MTRKRLPSTGSMSGGKFVRRYRELAGEIRAAARDCADDVCHARFPTEEHTYPGPRPSKKAAAE
jgi:ketopantoate hydroxymethyltransferase